jgi:hypothetical protein
MTICQDRLEGCKRRLLRSTSSFALSTTTRAASEEDMPLFQGIVIAIGAAGAEHFPLNVQIMHASFSPIAEVLASRVFRMLPEDEQARRRRAADAKKQEIAARRLAQQMSETATRLQVGTAPLNQFVCLVLDEDSRLFNWLADSRDVAAVAEISSPLGFGVCAWGDHNYPQTFARLVTGGVGFYDFSSGTASRIPHLQQEESFELQLRTFDGS